MSAHSRGPLPYALGGDDHPWGRPIIPSAGPTHRTEDPPRLDLGRVESGRLENPLSGGPMRPGPPSLFLAVQSNNCSSNSCSMRKELMREATDTVAPRNHAADTSIDAFISKRDEQRRKDEGETAADALWAESVRRYNARQDADHRLAWCAHYRRMRSVHWSLGDEYDAKLRDLENCHHEESA